MAVRRLWHGPTARAGAEARPLHVHRGMVVDDQHAVIEWLSQPSTYGPGCHDVERIDTHSAVVFLAGAGAYKLKRAVKYDYLDFSTPERRRACCDAELRLNRRTAPSLYRAVRAIVRDRHDRLAFDGDGTPVDWVLEMTRFPGDALCDRLAETGRLPLSAMPALADAVAALHAMAARRPDKGGADGLRWVVDGNDAAFREFGGAVLPPARVADLTGATRDWLARRAGLLDERRAAGLVRQCHGDLHLRNLVMLDGVPTPFDAIEFNDDIASVDTGYDLAFLLMDLCHRGLRPHANAVLGEYLRLTGDVELLSLLPLFLACRAAVRAKVEATAAALQPAPARAAAAARAYLELALAFLHPPPPVLVAVGGRSGTGKSTLSAALAPGLGAAPGAWLLRSDVERKMLFGVAPGTRLPGEAYSRATSARVYAGVRVEARLALDAGHAVVCDAVFGQQDERAEMARVAVDASVPFVGLWLEVPDDVAITRVTARQHDASDADAAVVRAQSRAIVPPADWIRVDASGSAADTLARAASALARGLPG